MQKKNNDDDVDNENRNGIGGDVKRKEESADNPARHPTSIYVNTLA